MNNHLLNRICFKLVPAVLIYFSSLTNFMKPCTVSASSKYETQNYQYFVVKQHAYIPLFSTYESDLNYENGLKGQNCYDLDTVLLPFTPIQIIESTAKQSIKIKYHLCKSYTGSGFIHKKFFNESLDQIS